MLEKFPLFIREAVQKTFNTREKGILIVLNSIIRGIKMTLVLFDAENAKEQILCLKFSKNIKNDEKGLFIVMISNLRILVLI